MSNPVLTDDTLKALEELIEKGTQKENVELIYALRNNAPELLRLARLGLNLHKDGSL